MHFVQHNEHMLHVPWPWSDFYTRTYIDVARRTPTSWPCVANYYYTLQRYVDFVFSLMKVPFIWDSHDVSRCFIRTPKNQAMRSLSLNKLPYLVHIEWYHSRYGNISETNFHTSIWANNQIWANVKSAQCNIPWKPIEIVFWGPWLILVSWSRSWILLGLSSEYIRFPTENRQSSLFKQVGGCSRYGISASCSLSAVPWSAVCLYSGWRQSQTPAPSSRHKISCLNDSPWGRFWPSAILSY